LLRRSPADRGLACVSVSTTVSVPAPGVIVALALHASLQPPEAVNENGTACAPELTNSGNSASTAAPARIGEDMDFGMRHASYIPEINHLCSRNFWASAEKPQSG